MSYNNLFLHNDWNFLIHNSNISFEIINLEQKDNMILDNSSLVYIGLHGIVSISKRYSSNKLVTLYLINLNNVIFSVDTNINYYLEVKAFTKSTLLIISFADFYTCKRYHSQLLKLELDSLNSKLYYIELFANIFHHKNIVNKFLSFILIMCKNFGIIYPPGILIDLEISQLDISKIIGCSRVTVTRLINLLKKKLIIIINRKIMVYNPVYLTNCIINNDHFL
uniref:global nitrogen transcriptional regulator n=1 Tax=Pulvinaster venetus TaxID=427767 RepID=UPI001FCE2394|nr:global nitrogen transcriptional regulator [Pulvinaster venetus]UNJ16944.1 global nitrogen transcriptional regulator [Pulvinaster venetus]